MDKPLLILDVDGTLLDKSEIANGVFVTQSLTGYFGFPIALTLHPVTGKPDHSFRRTTLREAWKQKITQVLEAQGSLTYILQDGDTTTIRNVEEVDLDELTQTTKEGILYRLDDPEIMSKGTIHVYTKPEDLQRLKPYVAAIGVASLDNRLTQTKTLEIVGYNPHIEVGLRGFAENGENKHAILQHVVNAYRTHHQSDSTALVSVGDTPHDMEATNTLEGDFPRKAVGVLTGGYEEAELRNAGADYIIPKLNNKGVTTLIQHIEENT